MIVLCSFNIVSRIRIKSCKNLIVSLSRTPLRGSSAAKHDACCCSAFAASPVRKTITSFSLPLMNITFTPIKRAYAIAIRSCVTKKTGNSAIPSTLKLRFLRSRHARTCSQSPLRFCAHAHAALNLSEITGLPREKTFTTFFKNSVLIDSIEFAFLESKI